MGNRSYNILFHTHTVSGILISVALYVIFFAGSFSFFRDEIVNWERGHVVKGEDELHADFNSLLGELDREYRLKGRDLELRHYYNERRISVNIGVSRDSAIAGTGKNPGFFYLDPVDGTRTSYTESYTLGEFLYRLHFFAQIPYPYGYYLSGFVAFFFLFAIITGIVVHWKKIIPNFFVFRPKAKLKTLWTDAHTALGVIGFPFQFVYAITGAFFMLKLLLVAPGVYALYNGDEQEFYDAPGYGHPGFEYHGRELELLPDINALVTNTRERWPDFRVNEVRLFNFGDSNMHVSVSGRLSYSEKFNGTGNIIYRMADGRAVAVKDPVANSSYPDAVKNILYRLHLGDYGGYALRITSFVLGLIGCFVILSGVMIWFTARNKTHLPIEQRKFNLKVSQWYLAICLSMFPVTAAAFIVVKCFNPLGMNGIYSFYFISWALLSVFFAKKGSAFFTNTYSLLSGGILGLLVPVCNGAITGAWPWNSLMAGAFHVFFIDLFWVVLSALSLLACFRLKAPTGEKKTHAPAKPEHPHTLPDQHKEKHEETQTLHL